MTEQNLTTKPEQNLVNQDIIRKAQSLSSGYSGVRIPFIPTIKVNNKKEKKEMEVDGKMQIVELPAKKGFLITQKTDQGYETNFYKEELEAVILRERYKVRSKYKVEPAYFSFEFDRWDEIIPIMLQETKDKITKGTYTQLRDYFSTEEKDSRGRPKKTFDLFLVLYLDIDGEIKRFEQKMTSYNNWFDYKGSFGSNDVFVAYKTKFNLKESAEGEIKFWYTNLERGDNANLAEEIKLQKEIQQFFNIVDTASNPQETIEEVEEVKEVKEVESDEVNLADVPF